jgi:hypothetical protein
MLCEVPRYTALERAQFEALVRDGQPFVVEDVGARARGWGMAGWTCDDFATKFPQATIVHHYIATGEKQTTMREAAREAPEASGCPDPEGPQLGPQYWGIKEAAFDADDADNNVVKSNERPYLRVVREASLMPYFMPPEAEDEFHATPEIWLSKAGAGAQAHADAHCGSTVSIQLSGTKRWRLSAMWHVGPLTPEYTFDDGHPYRHAGPWNASFVTELRPGEALVFPPSFIHETLATSSECAASITHQFDEPLASGFWHREMNVLRRAFDINECWDAFGALYKAFLSGASARQLLVGRLLPAEMAALAAEEHRRLDRDGDGCVRARELPPEKRGARHRLAGMPPARWERALLGAVDGDHDGCVTQLELVAALERWALVERAATEEWFGRK